MNGFGQEAITLVIVTVLGFVGVLLAIRGDD